MIFLENIHQMWINFSFFNNQDISVYLSMGFQAVFPASAITMETSAIRLQETMLSIIVLNWNHTL